MTNLDAAIAQINGMGYYVRMHQYRQTLNGYCEAVYIDTDKYFGFAAGETITEAVLNLLDKLKTAKELG